MHWQSPNGNYLDRCTLCSRDLLTVRQRRLGISEVDALVNNHDVVSDNKKFFRNALSEMILER